MTKTVWMNGLEYLADNDGNPLFLPFHIMTEEEKVKNTQDFEKSIIAMGEKILAGCDRITGSINTIEKELQK